MVRRHEELCTPKLPTCTGFVPETLNQCPVRTDESIGYVVAGSLIGRAATFRTDRLESTR